MTLEVKSIEMNPSDDEGLAFVYFDLGDFCYFTVCYSTVDKDGTYIEYNSQEHGCYVDIISYRLVDNGVIFEYPKSVSEQIRLESPVLLNFKFEDIESDILRDCLQTIFHNTDSTVYEIVP